MGRATRVGPIRIQTTQTATQALLSNWPAIKYGIPETETPTGAISYTDCLELPRPRGRDEYAGRDAEHTGDHGQLVEAGGAFATYISVELRL
jgi:hypothetical protein